MWLLLVLGLNAGAARRFRTDRPRLLWAAAAMQAANGLLLLTGGMSPLQSRRVTGYACVLCLLGLALVMNGMVRAWRRESARRRAAASAFFDHQPRLSQTPDLYVESLTKEARFDKDMIAACVFALEVPVIVTGMRFIHIP